MLTSDNLLAIAYIPKLITQLHHKLLDYYPYIIKGGTYKPNGYCTKRKIIATLSYKSYIWWFDFHADHFRIAYLSHGDTIVKVV